MQIVIDCSHFSGTDLDRDIIAYAINNYGFVPSDYDMFDSEEIQWEADEALMWIDGLARNAGYCYFIEDNCLFTDSYAELSL